MQLKTCTELLRESFAERRCICQTNALGDQRIRAQRSVSGERCAAAHKDPVSDDVDASTMLESARDGSSEVDAGS